MPERLFNRAELKAAPYGIEVFNRPCVQRVGRLMMDSGETRPYE
jgi:hypothetical protein